LSLFSTPLKSLRTTPIKTIKRSQKERENVLHCVYIITKARGGLHVSGPGHSSDLHGKDPVVDDDAVLEDDKDKDLPGK
jgi:hypothetical protein